MSKEARMSRSRGPMEATFAAPLRALGRAEAAARRYDEEGELTAAVKALSEIRAALQALPQALKEAAAVAAPQRAAIAALLADEDE